MLTSYPNFPSCYFIEQEQGSKEWLRCRNGVITASRMSAILGINRFTSPEECAVGILFGDNIEPTIQMLRGTHGETLIRSAIEKQTGLKITTVGLGIWKENPLFCASADGIFEELIDDESNEVVEGNESNGVVTGIIEIKVFSSTYNPEKMSSGMYDFIKNESSSPNHIYISPDHYNQMQFTAGVLGAKKIKYCTFFMPTTSNMFYNSLLITDIPVDPSIFLNCHIPKALEFYDKLVRPNLTYIPPVIELLK